MPSGAALLADWQSVFGPEFPQLLPFLELTARQARSFPCPEQPPCECRHIIRETDEGFSAVCTCTPTECHPSPVQPKDLMLHTLDVRELGNAICHTSGFTPLYGPAYSTTAIHEIGSYGPMLAPVYLAIARPEALLNELENLFAARPASFILLTPTAASCTPDIASALHRHNCARISLSAVLHSPITPIMPITPIGQLLAPFTARLSAARESDQVLQEIHRNLSSLRHQLRRLPGPPRNEPVPEDAARHAFALVQKLDTESPMKPPTLLTVFRLYCMEEMTTGRIARKCGCSKGTVIGRLRLIRQKTGVDPEAMRRLSPHFEKIESDIADSRAEHIHRKGLIYDDPDSEE